MGVCLNNNYIKNRQQKLKESICIDINENKINDDNKNEDSKEKQNCLEDNQLDDENKKNQNMTNENGIIYYSFQSRFKSKLLNYSKNGHLSNKYSNKNYIDIKNNDNFENLVHFTNFIDKKINNVSGITNTTTK